MASKLPQRPAAILAADIADYPALKERSGAVVVDVWRRARATVIDPAVARHAGRLVNVSGHGFLAEFPAAENAVQAALSIQDAFAAMFAGLPRGRNPECRMGINIGEVWADADDLYGADMSIAARLQSLADPGGVCISGTVRDAIKHKIAARYEDIGLQHVNNVPEPVHAWRVQRAARPTPATVSRDAAQDDDTMRTAYLSPTAAALTTAAFEPTVKPPAAWRSLTVSITIALLVTAAFTAWVLFLAPT